MRDKILVTGFEPFGGMEQNPTQQLVSSLDRDAVPGLEIHTLLLPVAYDDCLRKAVAEIERLDPAAVISCGLYAGRSAVTPERVGLNVKDTMAEDPIPDNAGHLPVDEPIGDGPDALFATLPVRAIAEDIRAAGIPSFVSNTAGTYICNNTLYGVLDQLRRTGSGVLAGFIHFPASTEMAVSNPILPSLPLETMRRALIVAIESVGRSLPSTSTPDPARLAGAERS
jgi:pyroglutamyl-peptidase